MLRLLYRPGVALATLALMGLFSQAAGAAGWGTIKGTVVFADPMIPANEKANVDKDKAHCLSKGDILANKLVVNPKNKGVRYVLVWLADPKDPKNAKFKPDIHPSLQNLPKTVAIDQPCCSFEPRMIGLVEGQTLTVKNSAPIPHNFAITSIGGGPTTNPLIPSKGQVEIKGFVPKMLPTMYSCSIHGWMKGWIGTFSHPYFAITDEDGNFEIKNAPEGKFRLMLWQEEAGWVVAKSPMDRGKVIQVKAGETLEVGKIPLKLPQD